MVYIFQNIFIDSLYIEYIKFNTKHTTNPPPPKKKGKNEKNRTISLEYAINYNIRMPFWDVWK